LEIKRKELNFFTALESFSALLKRIGILVQAFGFIASFVATHSVHLYIFKQLFSYYDN